jgi:hypothetical protein
MPDGAVRHVHPLRRLKFAAERLQASARAGSYLGRFRKRVRFAARGVEQDGVMLLMPKEPSFAFYYVPLAVASVAIGAGLAAFS